MQISKILRYIHKEIEISKHNNNLIKVQFLIYIVFIKKLRFII